MSLLQNCRSCSSKTLTPVLDFGYLHLSGFPLPGEPLPPKAPLLILFCESCTLVQGAHVAAPDEFFREYWYRSSISGSMQQALHDVASGVQERLTLRGGDLIVSIGCNNGFELTCYPDFLEKVGFEPARNLVDEARANNPGAVIVNDYFSKAGFEGVTGRHARVVQAIACMYSVPQINEFLADVRGILSADGLFVAQFTGLKHTLQNNDLGNFTQEHVSFFSLSALELLYERAGLHVFDYEENGVNGGSMRVYASPQSRPRTSAFLRAVAEERLLGLDHPECFANFRHNISAIREKCLEFVSKERAPYVYAASTKANLLLQVWGLSGENILGAADRDERKWGRTTTTGIPIVSEAAARAAASAMVVMPLGFRAEFVKREEDFTLKGGKLYFPNEVI